MNQQETQKLNIQWYPGHMAKARRNIKEDFALVDVVVEVLDARIPYSSRNPDLAELLEKKPQILVLNKKDLAAVAETDKWLAEYRRQGYFALAINAAQKQGINLLLDAVKQAAEPLMQKLEQKGRLRRPIRAMIIGVPNTGKSTVINSLTPRAAAITGNKPGVTKGRQWIKTAVGIEMLDTPGVLWPKFANYRTAFNLAVCGSISDQIPPMYEIALSLADYLLANGLSELKERYRLDETPADKYALLEAVGRRRGLLVSGGMVRLEDAGLLLIHEFRAGKLGRHTLDKSPENFKEAAEL